MEFVVVAQGLTGALYLLTVLIVGGAAPDRLNRSFYSFGRERIFKERTICSLTSSHLAAAVASSEAPRSRARQPFGSWVQFEARRARCLIQRS